MKLQTQFTVPNKESKILIMWKVSFLEKLLIKMYKLSKSKRLLGLL